MRIWKLGTFWGKGKPDFYEMIRNKSIVLSHLSDTGGYFPSEGDIVIVTNGFTVKAITRLKERTHSVLDDPMLEPDFDLYKIDYDKNVLYGQADWFELSPEEQFLYNLQDGISEVRKKSIVDQTLKLLSNYIKKHSMINLLNLLKYKKQIILQGPPGTGKTKLAKEIAAEITGIIPGSKYLLPMDKLQITQVLFPGESIKMKGGKDLKIMSFEDKTIKVKTDDSQEWLPSYEKIINSYNSRLFNDTGRSGGYIPYEDAIAKHLFGRLGIISHQNENDQVKMIQFHPSYSYEDFVRGIVATPNENGDGISFSSENKVFGKFVEVARLNFINSHRKTEEVSSEINFGLQLKKFIEKVSESIDLSGEFKLGEDTNAKIIGVIDDAFIYSFDKRKEIKYRLLFTDLAKINSQPKEITRSIDIRDIEESHLRMKGKYPYYFRVYNLIKAIPKNDFSEITGNIKLKNFVFIIDEINRANLSSVLGELIYALEYRGESVDSMYEVDGSNKLVLPPNLYIIGTMNTADRSVGHIDYAIRRRFAFVDVMPEDLSSELKDDFMQFYFNKVSSFFYDTLKDYLSSEFEPGQVCLGHSYFIQQYVKDDFGIPTSEKIDFKMRLKYEIIPILEEYIRDGVLKNNAELQEEINQLKQAANA